MLMPTTRSIPFYIYFLGDPNSLAAEASLGVGFGVEEFVFWDFD